MTPLEAAAWVVLFLLLLRALSKLQQVYALIRPEAPLPPSLLDVPVVLLRKAAVTARGSLYLIFSRDKVSSAAIRRAPDAAELAPSGVTCEVRLIFVRHGESVWNLVFNRGFTPSILWRLLTTLLYELYLVPLDDSAFLDSPLSELGMSQCEALCKFLSQPCVDPLAKADFAALTTPGAALLVSSPLRRCIGSLAISLHARLQHGKEPILLHSSLQEISRNFDTQSLAPPGGAPPMSGSPKLEAVLNLDGSANDGNKSFGFTGAKRLEDFAHWATAPRQDKTIIVCGHSLWFRNFFQLYLPKVRCLSTLHMSPVAAAHRRAQHRIGPTATAATPPLAHPTDLPPAPRQPLAQPIDLPACPQGAHPSPIPPIPPCLPPGCRARRQDAQDRQLRRGGADAPVRTHGLWPAKAPDRSRLDRGRLRRILRKVKPGSTVVEGEGEEGLP
jgi:hypothetical protein